MQVTLPSAKRMPREAAKERDRNRPLFFPAVYGVKTGCDVNAEQFVVQKETAFPSAPSWHSMHPWELPGSADVPWCSTTAAVRRNRKTGIRMRTGLMPRPRAVFAMDGPLAFIYLFRRIRGISGPCT